MKERIGSSSPHEEITPHEAIRQHVEGAVDWEWREMATRLYGWADRFNGRFFGGRMPNVLLSFDKMNVRTLAAYTLKRNPQGLLYEITMNTRHLDRSEWQILETLMHECVHLWQQNFGDHPVSYNYHNREFVAKCEEIGLHPLIGSGVHVRPADGKFADLLKAYGVPEPPPLGESRLSPKRKPMNWWTSAKEGKRGRSTLAKWTCGCQNVRVGAKDFQACRLKCGNVFKRVDEAAEMRAPAPKEGEPDASCRQFPIIWPEPEPPQSSGEEGGTSYLPVVSG